MGCDIHLTAEYRDKAGVWHNDDLTTEPDEYGDTDPHHKQDYDHGLYNGRNYDLFAILADVRNGRGFAGVKTGEGFEPIADPRGVPHDAAEITRDYQEAYGSDGHSHSYFTVAELLAYDWTQTTTKQGVVGYRELARWKLQGAPTSWSGSIDGPGITQHDGADSAPIIDKLINGKWWDVFHGFADEGTGTSRGLDRLDDVTLVALAKHFGPRPVFTVRWETPYYEAAGSFLSRTLPKLWRMGAPDDVRIVFFFDN